NVLKMGPQDLFIAHEVYLMRPLFIQDDAYLKFLQANLWAKKFLPNAGVSKNYDVKSKTNRSCFQILPFTFYFLDLVEGLAKKTQLWYMRKRRTTETVSDDLIKFHPQDVRVQVLENWKKKRPIFFASFCL
ncbi:MAG: hypothetical protein Q8P89_01750, partial [bacterium]|nr:hypothetical protein [bacterium]